MYGTVNTPGVSIFDLRDAVDALAASIISGDVSAPLEVTADDTLCTRDGVEIRAHRKLNGADNTCSDVHAVVTAAVANMTRMVEREYLAVR